MKREMPVVNPYKMGKYRNMFQFIIDRQLAGKPPTFDEIVRFGVESLGQSAVVAGYAAKVLLSPMESPSGLIRAQGSGSARGDLYYADEEPVICDGWRVEHRWRIRMRRTPLPRIKVRSPIGSVPTRQLSCISESSEDQAQIECRPA